jgi:hypothetical protein
MLVATLTIVFGLLSTVLALGSLVLAGKYNALVTLRKRCWEARQEIYLCDLQILARARALLKTDEKHLPSDAPVACDDFEAAAHRSAAMLNDQSAVKGADITRQRILDSNLCESAEDLAQALRNHNKHAESFNRALSSPIGWSFRLLCGLRPVPAVAEIARA